MSRHRLWLLGAWVVVTITSSPCVWAADVPPAELSGAVIFYGPSEERYKDGVGGEGQLRVWIDKTVGLAFSGGIADWDVKKETSSTFDPIVGSVQMDRSGTLTVAPLGASLLVRSPGERARLILEAGLRYVVVESDIKLNSTLRDTHGRVVSVIMDEAEVEDGVVAVAALDLDIKLADSVWLFGGGGYQADIVKGDIKSKVFGWDVGSGKNELAAAAVRGGLRIAF